MSIYPVTALRTAALAAQGLHRSSAGGPADGTVTRDDIYHSVQALGCVQIDTLQMVARSQYLVLWSRLGSYDPADLDALASPLDRRLFEGWQHAACLIPLNEYRYQLPAQRSAREHPSSWYTRWLEELQDKEIVAGVHARIRRKGGMRVSDFESDGRPGGSWWSWRPAKVALEVLYSRGELMVSERRKFQRVYDLTRRVLPKGIDRTDPGVDGRDRFWVERGARAMGVGLPRHAGDYTWMKITRSRPIVADLLQERVLLPVQGRLMDGSTAELVIHRDNLPLLEQAADGALRAGRTTFLSPFDNLFWADRRDGMFWGYRKALECYVPAHKRIYGYYSMPILHHDALVGRFDPKLERKNGRLILRSLLLEPGVDPDEQLVRDFIAALQDFMRFHHAGELVIERSEPASFGNKIMKGWTG